MLSASRSCRSLIRRTFVRATGTAMLVRTSRIVNATINSTSVMPRWRLPLATRPLGTRLHQFISH